MNAHVDPHASHATYAPSSAHRWTVCTASAEAIARLPAQEESEAAAKGTAAHEELERILNGEQADPDHASAYGIALAVAYIRKLPAGRMWIEQRVALTEQIWGRLDCGHWHAESETVTIVDLKDGFVDVSPVENDQERIYAASLISMHNLPVKWIRYVIVQPNSIVPGPRVKQWIESVESLNAWAAPIAAIPTSPKKFVAGEQCTYCPLFGRCDASRDILANVGALVAGLMTPDQVSPAQRALFMACEKPIKDAFTSSSKVWLKDALSHGAPSGLKVIETVKHRAWKNENEAREVIYAAKGIDALKPPTPAQAEDMGINIAWLADKPAGGPALAFESDKRKPWVQKSAAEMFAGIPGVTP